MIDFHTAATITTNIKGSIVCPGEHLILTCTGVGVTQRWDIGNDDRVSYTFTAGNGPGTRYHIGSYQFTLVSSTRNHFQSTLTTFATIVMNNTVVECNDGMPADRVTIRIAGSEI